MQFRYCELRSLWQDSEFLTAYPKRNTKASEDEGRRTFTLSSNGNEWQQSFLNSGPFAKLLDKHRAELSKEVLKRLSEGDDFRLITPLTVYLPPERSPYGHKNDYGHVYVLAGSYNMPGAGNLSAVAALRAGAGLVTRFLPKMVTKLMPYWFLQYLGHPSRGEITLRDEIILKYVDSSWSGCRCDQAILDSLANDRSVLVVGPGMEAKDKAVVKWVLSKTNAPTVIDATALSFITPKTRLPDGAVLTPHPGEAARLLGVSTKDVQDNRIAAARELAAKYKAVIVLKGAFTIVCEDGEVSLSDIANPYLATAGSGDVLSGVIAAFIAQGMEPKAAAEAAVYIHGLAGELASDASGGEILSGDIASCLARAKAEVRNVRN